METNIKDWEADLKDNYLKGGTIVCGLEEMTRFISKLLSTQEEKIKEKIIREIKDSRDADSCECDNCHRWRRYSRPILLK